MQSSSVKALAKGNTRRSFIRSWSKMEQCFVFPLETTLITEESTSILSFSALTSPALLAKMNRSVIPEETGSSPWLSPELTLLGALIPASA